MGKVKSKNKSEIEYLRGENKKLKSQLSSLNKRNKHLEKEAHFYEEVIEDASDEVSMGNRCDNCGKGHLITHDLFHVVLEICDLCGFKRNINGKKTKENK